MNPIQKYTDLTYGTLLLCGLLSVALFENSLSIGLGIGIFIGYIVHVGSEMIEFNKQLDSVEESAENAEARSEEVYEKVEETADKIEETSERVEETRDKVQSVEEKTDRVEGAVNGE